jgi:hypothetical protein
VTGRGNVPSTGAAENGDPASELLAALLGTAADMHAVAERRVPGLRACGLDDLADDIDALAAGALASAQELAAAAGELP